LVDNGDLSILRRCRFRVLPRPASS
jgi:hypothetical protein